MVEPIKIDLIFTGGYWCNQSDVESALESISDQQNILFDTGHEGPSLVSCGFIDLLNDWVVRTGRNPKSICIDTPNQYEQLPYKFAYPRPVSHFLTSEVIKYDLTPRTFGPDSRLFGLFVGRYTADRNMMVRDMLKYLDNFLFSVMPNSDTDLNAPYTITYDLDVRNIGSIDNKETLHLSDLTTTTNSLLSHYGRFQIEVVPETITSGQSFFVTEKTVRPIVGSKPMLIFGAINFLKNLQNLGFKTFDSLWSEEYDRYEGLERWNLIKKNIADVIEHGYNRDKAQEIVDYNYRHLINHFLLPING